MKTYELKRSIPKIKCCCCSINFIYHVYSSPHNMLPVVNYLRLVDGGRTRLWTFWDIASALVGCRQILGGPLQACGHMIKLHHHRNDYQ